MSRIFVTSDLHFGHDKDFLWKPRGFSSIQEHDNEVIRRWNSIVTPEDSAYVLGDIVMKDIDHGIGCLRRLNGTIYIVLGNHDSTAKIQKYELLENVFILSYAYVLRYRKYIFYLSHYPTITSNYDIDKPLKARVINLCGHSHTNNPWQDFDKGIIYHVELDAHNCYPVLLDDVIEEIKSQIYNSTLKNE